MLVKKSIVPATWVSILSALCLMLAGCAAPVVQGSRELPGTITIVKDAVPDSAQDFYFYASGPNSACCDPFPLDDDADPTLSNSKTFTLEAGSYTFAENLANPVPVTGWQLASITCDSTDAMVDMSAMLFTVNLAAGQNITCTFVNTPVWPMQETVYVYNPQTPFGPQTVNISAGGTVTFVDVSYGGPFTATYLSGPQNFSPIPSGGTTPPLPTGTYQYMLDTGTTIPGTIIVH